MDAFVFVAELSSRLGPHHHPSLAIARCGWSPSPAPLRGAGEDKVPLTLPPAGSKEAAIVSGPATDFRGEHFPKQDPPVGLILKGWAGDAYLVRAMPKISPFKFLQEVRAEGEKVTWPTRKETTVTTIMVFVMVAIASVFFLLADQVMRVAVSYVLGIGM